MLDGNSNMRQSDSKSALEFYSLKEVFLKTHGLNGPATFRRNNTKTPIDGIWVSPSIEVQACGYFDYDSVFVNTDHRCLWADISFVNAFGHNMPVIVRPAARRLHCKDPCIMANYVKVYKSFILKNNLLSKVRQLKRSASYPLLETHKYTYDEMDSLRCKGIQLAEKNAVNLGKDRLLSPLRFKWLIDGLKRGICC